MSSFHEYLRTRLETGGFSTEDALGSFLPLVREVLEAHAARRVAPAAGTVTAVVVVVVAEIVIADRAAIAAS